MKYILLVSHFCIWSSLKMLILTEQVVIKGGGTYPWFDELIKEKVKAAKERYDNSCFLMRKYY